MLGVRRSVIMPQGGVRCRWPPPAARTKGGRACTLACGPCGRRPSIACRAGADRVGAEMALCQYKITDFPPFPASGKTAVRCVRASPPPRTQSALVPCPIHVRIGAALLPEGGKPSCPAGLLLHPAAAALPADRAFAISCMLPPGKSVRPQEPANSVSPLNSSP